MSTFKLLMESKVTKALNKKAEKSGYSVKTLRKVFNRGVVAWRKGHRPGTTPTQWGLARVNAFIVKRKKGTLNHDKDLAEQIEARRGHRYHRGMPEKAEARERHFRKQKVGGKGFKPAPGDKSVDVDKMPKSQYTKAYHNL